MASAGVTKYELNLYRILIVIPLIFSTVYPVVSSACYDTNYMADSYTALQYPDREINDVQREAYCRTHCSGSESCAAYSYNASSATCFLSREASVIQDDLLENTAYVKKRFSRSLDVLEHPTVCQLVLNSTFTTTSSTSWDNARQECTNIDQNTDLVVIEDDNKQAAVKEFMSGYSESGDWHWIGAKQQAIGSQTIFWIDNTTLPLDWELWSNIGGNLQPNELTTSKLQCVGMKLADNELKASDSPCADGHNGHNGIPAICETVTKAEQCSSSAVYKGLYDKEKCNCTHTSFIFNSNAAENTCMLEIIYCGKDCQAAFIAGDIRSDEVYLLRPGRSPKVFKAVCEFDSSSGWTVIQRRLDGTVDFFRNYVNYTEGFGNIYGEYWLGLDFIYYLTQRNRKLSIYMEDHEGNSIAANYSMFHIDAGSSDYRLHVSGYTGDAGDSLTEPHNNQPFATMDHDPNFKNCPNRFKGAWWYGDIFCHHSNLNGLWIPGGQTDRFAVGIIWYSWKGHHYSLKAVTFKVSV